MPILTFTSGPNTGRKKYVLRRISNGQIINRGVAYPTTTDDSEIIGLDPDLEYLAMDQDAQPDYDPRMYSLSTAEARTPESGSPAVWHIGYVTTKRVVDEIKANAANVEAAKNRLHYTEQERDKVVILALGVLFRLINNQQLTAKETALKQRIITMATAVWKNDTRLRDIFTALDANQEPDLDALWEPAPSNP